MIAPYIKILKNRNFFLLWFGQIISQFGDRLTQMALIGLVHKLQPGSTIGLAKIFSLAIIPVFLISPVAGVYVDRWDKRKTMYVSDAVRGLAILLIPLICYHINSLLLVYVLIFFSFCFGRFFIPAKMAIVPSLVAEKEFFLANSLVSITAMVAAVFGLGVGALIVENWGVKTAFIIDAGTFFVSALFIFFINIKEKAHFNPHDLLTFGKEAILNVKQSVIREAKEGVTYILSSQETKYAFVIMFTLFAAIGALYPTFIVFIQNTLATAVLDVGWVGIGAGAGLFIGSILYGRVGAQIPVKKAVNSSLLVSCLWLVTFTTLLRFYPYRIFAFLSFLLLGLLCSPIVIAVNTLIHQKSENNFWGRIFSSLEVIIHLGFIIFMFISAYLADIMTPFTIIVSVSIIMILLSVWNLLRKK